MLSSARLSIALFFGSLILFTVGLSGHEFTQFETRFAYFAYTFSHTQFHFFPLVYGKLYPDYPASYPLLIYFFSLIFGKLNVFSAVWPSAINAAGTVVLTYHLGARYKLSWGVSAVLFEFATYCFLISARSLSLDMFVLFATTLSVYLVLTKSRYYLFLPWVFIYGFVFRGPLGLVMPLAVVTGVHFVNSDYKNLIKTLLMGVFLFFLLGALLLFCAYREGGVVFARQVMAMEMFSRVKVLGHAPFNFYLNKSFLNYALSFPVAFLVVLVNYKIFFKKTNHHEIKFLKCLLVWVLIVLGGMSIPSQKKLRYILPMVPALSLLSGRLIVDNTSWVLAQLRSMLLKISFLFPLFGLFAIAATQIFAFYHKMELGGHPFWGIIFLILAFMISKYCLKLWDEKITQYNIKLAAGVGAFMILIISMVQPIHAHANRTLLFAKILETSVQNQKIIFYKMGPDAVDINLMLALEKSDVPLFIFEEKELLSLPSKTIVVSYLKDYKELNEAIKKHIFLIYEGKIGHQSSVIFRKL